MSQEERSEALIDVLADLERSTIDFVLVGGYAVSQFETRFSTDLDLVIAPEDTDAVVTFLEEHDFERKNELDASSTATLADWMVSWLADSGVAELELSLSRVSVHSSRERYRYAGAR